MSGPAWLRRDGPGLALALAAMAWRAAVRSRSLVTFDAGLHANALREYDVPSGQPHPPGYPLSVLAGHIVDAVVRDPVAAMVWLSILWTGLTVWLLWRLGRDLAGPAAGAAAALLFVLSPLALFNGAVGLTYAADAASSTGVAWAAWRAGKDATPRRLAVLGIVLAAAIGVRPSAAFFLAPLALWPVLRAPGLRTAGTRLLWTAGAAAPAVLAWLVPMLLFGGGPAAILSANRVQSRTVVFPDTVFSDGWAVVPEHVDRLASFVPHELAALPWLVGAAAIAWIAAGARPALDRLAQARAHAAFLALWGLPALAFYVLLYVGWPVYPSGYLMVLLPVACLAVGAPLAVGLRHAPAARRPLVVTACALLLVAPAAGAAAAYEDVMAPARAADAWAASWDGFEAQFPVDSSAILLTESWQDVKREHPEYLLFIRARYQYADDQEVTRGLVSRHGADHPRWFELLAMDPDEAPVHAIPAGVERILIHEGRPDKGAERFVKDEVELHEATLPSGRVVRWFEPRPEWRTIEAHFHDVDAAWAEARLVEQGHDGVPAWP